MFEVIGHPYAIGMTKYKNIAYLACHSEPRIKYGAGFDSESRGGYDWIPPKINAMLSLSKHRRVIASPSTGSGWRPVFVLRGGLVKAVRDSRLRGNDKLGTFGRIYAC